MHAAYGQANRERNRAFSVLGEGMTMKLNKLFAIPAIALAAGLGLAACGSTSTPRPLPSTHTVTAPAPTPKATTPAPTTPAPVTHAAAPAPAKTVYVQQPAPAPVYVAPAQSSGNCGGGVNAGPDTSCPFAQAVAAAYNGPGADSEYVYSPVTGQSYWMSYTMSTGNRVYATGGNNASVTFTY
jgi:hypothetical protein